MALRAACGGSIRDVSKDRARPDYPPRELSDEALAWIVRLHSGEAGEADRKAFAAWRARSADHAAAVAEAEALWSDASEIHRDPATGLIRPGRRRRGRSRRAIIGGLVGLGAAGATGLWASGALRALLSDHSTGLAQTQSVKLPDDSRATLNARSAVNLDYSAQLRRVVLVEGQAFFEVAADPLRPFEVQVRDIVVTALGTAFDVNGNLPGNGVAVAVSEHAVRVGPRRPAGRSPSHESVVVSRDQSVEVGANGRIGPVLHQEAAVATAWRSGMYIAENKTLDEVVAAFRAYHRGWIVIRGARLKALKVNAVLDLRTPEASLAALAGGLPIRIDHVSPFLIVISAA